MNMTFLKIVTSISLLNVGALAGNSASADFSNYSYNFWETPQVIDINPYTPYVFDFSLPFRIKVDTRNSDPFSSQDSFIIPTKGTGYNYQVDCNSDGVNEKTGVTGDYTCSYSVPGEYTISINGTFPQIYFADEINVNQHPRSDSRKLISIEQWGTGKWRSMNNAFAGCANLHLTATDLPDLTNVTDMSYMFADVLVDQQSTNIGYWDVSNVQNMSGLFYKSYFNSDIGNWDVGSVINMNFMFDNATAFDQDLSNWNVSNVGSMISMFHDVTLSTNNYDKLLNSWFNLPLQENINFDGGHSQYSKNTSQSRSLYYSYHLWQISDGGPTW